MMCSREGCFSNAYVLDKTICPTCSGKINTLFQKGNEENIREYLKQFGENADFIYARKMVKINITRWNSEQYSKKNFINGGFPPIKEKSNRIPIPIKLKICKKKPFPTLKDHILKRPKNNYRIIPLTNQPEQIQESNPNVNLNNDCSDVEFEIEDNEDNSFMFLNLDEVEIYEKKIENSIYELNEILKILRS